MQSEDHNEAALAAIEEEITDAGKVSGVPPYSLFEDMCDTNVRFEAVWPFPMMPVPRALAEAIAEGADDEGGLPAELAALVSRWSEDELDELYEGCADAIEELSSAAFRQGLGGWIGIAATPVYTPYGSGSACAYSWGYYHTEMLFAPTADALLARAIAWGEHKHEKDRQNRG